MYIDESLKNLKNNRLMENNQQIQDYMVALSRVENSVSEVEYIPYLVAGIDNNTHEREVTASAITVIEDIIADNDVSFEAVMALLNSSLPDYENKYEFLDEVYFALLNYCVNDNILVDCYKALSEENQLKLIEVLNELKQEDKTKYDKIVEEIIKSK